MVSTYFKLLKNLVYKTQVIIHLYTYQKNKHDCYSKIQNLRFKKVKTKKDELKKKLKLKFLYILNVG